MNSEEIIKKANKILINSYGPDSKFREGQLKAIIAVVQKKKILVIQKTGWGKSIVYFIATRILREQGSGPSIILSPLLALMKNQVESATELGINAVTLNSDNKSDWEKIYRDLKNIDVIIISPERLSNIRFMEELAEIKDIQLFVVDEAHSISDWGHDFRPDYQRIIKLLPNLPKDITILGTTATANNRVIEDIKMQLGDDLEIVRGDLIRENLAIQINPTQNREQRLAWLVDKLNNNTILKEAQGIVYCLTQRDCEMVAKYLKQNGILAEAYHSGLGKNEVGNDIAQERIIGFDKGDIRILVATIKLGMGYDKADIRFVIHYQQPQNLISYYQQIGRAGRDGKKAYAILLYGEEDDDVIQFFIKGAQVKPELMADVLTRIGSGAKLNQLLTKVNIKKNKLLEILKYLTIHEYIYKETATYYRNVSSTFDQNNEKLKQKALNKTRIEEFENLEEYLNIESCYMKFVAEELDAPDTKEKCGICKNCRNEYLITLEIDKEKLVDATNYLKNKHGVIKPRKQWATGKSISKSQIISNGWSLSDDYYSEIGQKIKIGKYTDNKFSDELIDLSASFLKDKIKANQIDLVVAVPSQRRPDLVPNFAEGLARKNNIKFENIIEKTEIGSEQKELLNSVQQQQNIENSISITNVGEIKDKNILLVDDMVDSRWSFTIISAKLLEVGAKAVYPYALVKTGSGD